METRIDLYVLKAMDAYPYQLEVVVESLQYALSYDPENVVALTLMGRVHQEQFRAFEKAKKYYEKVLAVDLDYLEVYPHYIRALIDNNDLAEGQKLIDFALTRKGIDTAMIQMIQGVLFEKSQDFDAAIEAYGEAMMLAINSEFIEQVELEITRARNKRERLNRTKRKEEQATQTDSETKDSWFKNRLNNLL